MTSALLLIGSTGSGKSCLGNFLVDTSEENLFDKQHFKVAKANMPETQYVSAVPCQHKDNKYLVIDTPGLNESDVSDLKHMIQIVEHLQKVKSIMACVLVVRFNTKIDAQYKATVQYYRRLLPSLFERNVIIVMTDYASDSRSIFLRERQGIDVHEIKRNTLREIVIHGSLEYDPLIFLIDCLPIDDEERKLNIKIRSAIFSRFASQTPFPTESLMVAKTAFLRSEDREKIKSYEGEITGYNKRLQQVNAKAAEALEKIQKREEMVTEKEKLLTILQRDLKDKDSPELTNIGGLAISKEWKLFQWISKCFEKTVPIKIESVDKWTNGRCEWSEYEQTDYSVKGKLEGQFMRGIYASITLQTSKRTKYAEEISSLEKQIRELENSKRILKDHLMEIVDHFKEYTDDITLLEKFIEEKRALTNVLVSDYMPLAEARSRLKQLEERNQ